MKISTYNLHEFNLFAIEVAQALTPGSIVCLKGDLGVGKTEFAKRMIKFLTEDENLEVTSPTFNLVHVYHAKLYKIWHFDLYRLKHFEEVFELGIEEAFNTNAITIIEWPEIIEHLLKLYERTEINISFDTQDPNKRIIYHRTVGMERKL